MINFLHTFTPEAILFQLGPIKIYWYGFLMVIGGLCGLAVVLRLSKFYKIHKDDFYNLAFYWIVFGVLGGRIYYVIYSWHYYSQNLIDILKVWEGGLAVHGVMLGGFIATFVYCKKRNINFWMLADLVVVGFVLGQVIGRWGNYFNQEIFGLPTTLPWGLPIEISKRPLKYLGSEYFHPTVLYESFCNFIIFIDLLLLHWVKRTHLDKIFNGLIFSYYLIAYSILRFCLEFLRIDDSPLVFGIRWAQIYSILLIIFAIGLFVWLRKRDMRGKSDERSVISHR